MILSIPCCETEICLTSGTGEVVATLLIVVVAFFVFAREP